MLDVNFFDELRIGLATGDDIRQWSHGEVKKPETINYRTLRPEKDGLFCEKIFGPTRDWECYCGKYKRVRFKGIICERCGVEVTRAKVRRERMGHIELAAPVTHIWFFKGVPSRLGYLLDLAPKDLEKIIYFAAYLITSVDDEARHRDLPTIEAEISAEKSQPGEPSRRRRRGPPAEAGGRPRRARGRGRQVRRPPQGPRGRRAGDAADPRPRPARDRPARGGARHLPQAGGQAAHRRRGLYRELRDRFGEYFEGGMGAAALQKLLADFDLDAEAASLRETIRSGKGQRKLRALKRLKVVAAFLQTRNSPMGMVLDCVPVIPPDLRPMVQLDGGRFATSDMNDLYRRVINRNNRLKRLLDLGAPEIIVNNEKRMLQESVDALFDNGRRGRPVTGPGNRPLKSLSDLLKGKQGRFRQNLLGKRVDYSGRSVIVVGPQLKLHQCGLPKQMALELFKPFVMKRLVDLNHAQNIKSAKRMVERARPVVWDVLEEVITEHPVLLNRAPTLHRLGIQAFEPQLVEGKAIQIHPLVCTAFNADFDGDQMAVHLPLSAEAQAEARILMLSSNNILSPADGRPITAPTQDMVLGLYHITTVVPSRHEADGGRPAAFSSTAEAVMAYDKGALGLQERACIRLDEVFGVDNGPATSRGSSRRTGRRARRRMVETSLGRVLFNEALPEDYRFVNYQVPKKELGAIVNDLAERYPKVHVAATLDALKAAGFRWATRSGVTIAIDDVVTPPAKQEILDRHEDEARKIERRVRARPDHRRGAPCRADRDLDPRAGRGQPGDGGQLPDHQPGLGHGQLGRPRQHDADQPDRRHARPGGQPEGRDHPAADQGQLPGGSVRAGVLHLHARCPQGPGRHRAADRRLRLPHPPAGRRLAGRHHPRGGLRHRARRPHADRDRRSTACSPVTPHVETGVYARSLAADVVAEDGTVVARGRPGPGRRPHRPAGRRRRRRGQGALRADLRVAARHLRHLLRPVAGDRQAGGRRRGGRHHRRPVDR